MTAIRKIISTAHRWGGLVAGPWLSLVGLTGAMLVVAPTLFAWEHSLPSAPRERMDTAYASLDEWVERANAQYGALPAIESFNGPLSTPLRIAAPTMMYTTMREGSYASGVIAVDPYSGEPLAHFIAHDSWSMMPLKLHMAMFLPFSVMWTFLAATGVALLVLVLAGVASVRWQSARRLLRVPLPVSSPALRQAHVAVGLCASPFIMLAALTGWAMSDKVVAAAVERLLGRTTELTETACSGEAAISPGVALDAARRGWPGYELATLELRDDGCYAVALRRRGSTVPVRGDVSMIVERDGSLKVMQSAADRRLGDLFGTYLVELHGGRIAAGAGEVIVAIVGVALTFLPLAGIGAWIWRVRGGTFA